MIPLTPHRTTRRQNSDCKTISLTTNISLISFKFWKTSYLETSLYTFTRFTLSHQLSSGPTSTNRFGPTFNCDLREPWLWISCDLDAQPTKTHDVTLASARVGDGTPIYLWVMLGWHLAHAACHTGVTCGTWDMSRLGIVGVRPSPTKEDPFEMKW